MITKYSNYNLELIMNESMVNEKFNIDTIKYKLSNLNKTEIKKLSNKLFNQLKLTKKYVTKKNLLRVLVMLYLINAGNQTISSKFKPNNIDKIVDNISDVNITTQQDLISILDNTYDYYQITLDNNNLKNPSDLTISNNGIDFIKNHEKLRLEVYALNDTKLTIGYGHAEDSTTSRYKLNDKITIEEANKLLEQDLKIAEDGVKRIFKQWEDNNIKIHITQHMFDSMVSMAFNMGVGGLRQSMFIKELKKGDLNTAADAILTSRIGKKFSNGLKKRRKSEMDLFLKNYTV